MILYYRTRFKTLTRHRNNAIRWFQTIYSIVCNFPLERARKLFIKNELSRKCFKEHTFKPTFLKVKTLEFSLNFLLNVASFLRSSMTTKYKILTERFKIWFYRQNLKSILSTEIKTVIYDLYNQQHHIYSNTKKSKLARRYPTTHW